MNRDPLVLFKGTLDILILKTLTWGPKHGYDISKWVRQRTGDAIQIEEGALYPALRRLEKKGWLESEWGISDSNREVKFYSLTPEGRANLKKLVNSWGRYVDAMSNVLEAARATA
jgi:transcriptional regulator